jgi:hypothetical protein
MNQRGCRFCFLRDRHDRRLGQILLQLFQSRPEVALSRVAVTLEDAKELGPAAQQRVERYRKVLCKCFSERVRTQ